MLHPVLVFLLQKQRSSAGAKGIWEVGLQCWENNHLEISHIICCVCSGSYDMLAFAAPLYGFSLS